MSNINYNTRSTFDLKVGLKVPLKRKDALEAFNIFFNQIFEEVLIKNAKLRANIRFPKNRINRVLLYKYIHFLIYSGIVDLPQESLYFTKNTGFDSIFKSKDLLITLKELQFCKKILRCNRYTLSNIYNDTLLKVWNPTKFKYCNHHKLSQI